MRSCVWVVGEREARWGGSAEVQGAEAGQAGRLGVVAPERKVTPGMAGGRQRSRVWTVILAMVAGSDLSGHATPGTVIDGLSREPSRRTPLSWPAQG